MSKLSISDFQQGVATVAGRWTQNSLFDRSSEPEQMVIGGLRRPVRLKARTALFGIVDLRKLAGCWALIERKSGLTARNYRTLKEARAALSAIDFEVMPDLKYLWSILEGTGGWYPKGAKTNNA